MSASFCAAIVTEEPVSVDPAPETWTAVEPSPVAVTDKSPLSEVVAPPTEMTPIESCPPAAIEPPLTLVTPPSAV